jgi:high affinity Mn2+ porin
MSKIQAMRTALSTLSLAGVNRAGRFMQPGESNGLPLNKRIFMRDGAQVELEHAHTIGDQPGMLRFLAFWNKANVGGFRDALADAPNNGSVSDVSRTRKERVK